jgi:type VI secretion system secreted protein VgrG
MNRLLTAQTPLGNALRILSLDGREALSELYAFNLTFSADHSGIDCQALIGKLCAVAVETEDGGQRWLSGNMISFSATGFDGRHWRYAATVAPRLWHASRRSDFRIWQDMTVQDIVGEVLDKNGIPHEWRLKQPLKNWVYLVQYNETDLAFICRRLEHEGIYFWFEHGAGGETLVLADHFTSHPNCPGNPSIPFYASPDARAQRDHFDTWRLTREVETGRYQHTDYDFERPKTDLTTTFTDPLGHTYDQYERFHYPGNYIVQGDGSTYAANHLERLQVDQDVVWLDGRVRTMAPGHRFTLTEHPRGDQNRELSVISASYHLIDNDYGAASSQQTTFRIHIQAIPANRPWRPAQRTPIPRTRGPDTAVVVGPPGTEIHTDKYGRIKVHFHWDRYGKKDGTDTCWIRVSHPWAGTNFGAIHIPRIGQEVIVDYEHGDPDRPIITGRVYNAEQMPPWELPANMTQSGILTRSSLNGAPGAGMRDGPGDANALRFEDKKGEEQVWFHGQKDYLTEVENDESKWVGRDRLKEIDRNETTIVHGTRSETVLDSESVRIKDERTHTVKIDDSTWVGSNKVIYAGDEIVIEAGKNFTINCCGSMLRMTENGDVFITAKNGFLFGAKDSDGVLVGKTLQLNPEGVTPLEPDPLGRDAIVNMVEQTFSDVPAKGGNGGGQ